MRKRTPVLILSAALLPGLALAAPSRVRVGTTGAPPDAPYVQPADTIGAIGSLGPSGDSPGIGGSISGQSPLLPDQRTPPAITVRTPNRGAVNAAAVGARNPGAMLIVGLAVSGQGGQVLGVIAGLNRNAAGTITTVELRTSDGGLHAIPAGALRSQGGGVVSAYTLRQVEQFPG